MKKGIIIRLLFIMTLLLFYNQIQPDTTKHYYQLASELSKGKHNVEIFKRTEWNRGKTSF
jgi:hypothetical protein